jgi:hypothetical protein
LRVMPRMMFQLQKICGITFRLIVPNHPPLRIVSRLNKTFFD